MQGLDYIANVERVNGIIRKQSSVLAQAARLVVDCAQKKGRLFIHDPTWMIAYEAGGRSAGLYMAKPLSVADVPRSGLSENDVVVYFARRAFVEEGERFFLDQVKARGSKVIGVLPAGSPEGKKAVADYCDLTVNNGTSDNQGTVTVKGFAERLGPLDVVVNSVIVWALAAEVIGEFLRRGLTPSVYMTIRAKGGEGYNTKVWERFRRQGF